VPDERWWQAGHSALWTLLVMLLTVTGGAVFVLRMGWSLPGLLFVLAMIILAAVPGRRGISARVASTAAALTVSFGTALLGWAALIGYRAVWLVIGTLLSSPAAFRWYGRMLRQVSLRVSRR
jgi:hypothetical protein